MRKLITYRHSKGFYIYDNLLHGGELAGHSGILAVDRRCNITNSNETPRCPVRHGMVADHLYPAAGGIIAYLSFGELHLGKRRAERARAMWPSTAKWLNDLKACKHIFAEDNSPVAESLFKLCERRQGIGGVKGNQLQLLTESDDVMQALIRDIQLARHNIEMVFYIWQPGGMADSVAESLMAAARPRGSLSANARLRGQRGLFPQPMGGDDA